MKGQGIVLQGATAASRADAQNMQTIAPKITGTTFNRVFTDDFERIKNPEWHMGAFVPEGIDPNRYFRLRLMRVNRKSAWSIGCVDVSLTHLPSNTTSRSTSVSIEDSMQEAVMAMVIDTLARELETEIAVYERLEKAK